MEDNPLRLLIPDAKADAIPLKLLLAQAHQYRIGRVYAAVEYSTPDSKDHFFCLVPSNETKTLDLRKEITATYVLLTNRYGCTAEDIGFLGPKASAQTESKDPLPSDGKVEDVHTPDECAQAFRHRLPEGQRVQGIVALDQGLALGAAEILTRKWLSTEQGFALAKAYREGVPTAALEKMMEGDFSGSQIRELTAIAVNMDKNDILAECLHPEYSPEKIRLIGQIEQTLDSHPEAGESSGARIIPYDRLDEWQLDAVHFALCSHIPLATIGEYAGGDYAGDAMDAITDALLYKYVGPDTLPRILNPRYTAEQIRQLTFFISLIDEHALTSDQLDLLCNPAIPALTMEAAFHGLYGCGLNTDTVGRYLDPDSGLTPEQLSSMFDELAAKRMRQASETTQGAKRDGTELAAMASASRTASELLRTTTRSEGPRRNQENRGS